MPIQWHVHVRWLHECGSVALGFDSGPIGHSVAMIRRMFRKAGSMAVASFLWQHRGSVVRTVDLARRAPKLVQDGRSRDAVTELKAIVALDGKVPTSTDIRITGFDEGSMTLRGDVPADRLEETRTTLLAVDKVVDVRTVDSQQTTVDDAVAGAI